MRMEGRENMEANEKSILSVKELCLWYGNHQALKNINIDIPKNSITALIGPSGCGKSTFLKTLDRMNDLIPDVKITGSVEYKGEDIFAPGVDVSELRRQIGMVFQKPNPFPMSIYENIAFAPKTFGVKKKSEIDEIVECSLVRAGIWDEVNDRLRKSALGMSGGQQQRIAIARGGAGCAADGRAHERAGPHINIKNRRTGHAAEGAIHHSHCYTQYAAGRKNIGQHGVFPAGRAC